MDSASGRVEVLARRIGRNQMNALAVCRSDAEAQIKYASDARNDDAIRQYAKKVMNTPGHHDGLFAEANAQASLGTRGFAAAMAADGKKQVPYHLFRLLKSQGEDATGGGFDYVVHGK